MSDTLYTLVNPSFTFSFAGKEYSVRKANLEKAIQYQKKTKELQDAKDVFADLKLIAFCIFIVLKDVEPALTEDFVFQNTPADIDIMECLTTLGFMSPQRKELAKKLEKALENRLTSDNSSPLSPIEPDGLQDKSVI